MQEREVGHKKEANKGMHVGVRRPRQLLKEEQIKGYGIDPNASMIAARGECM